MGSYFRQRDLERLRELRAELLSLEERPEGAEAARYWRSRHDLELYDETLGQRIAWKWDAVLSELEVRGLLRALTPASGSILDWGCGTGVASRAWLRHSGAETEAHVLLWDRFAEAREFAAERLCAEHPGIAIEQATKPPAQPVELLLISHVLDELDEREADELCSLARRSRAVVWVEPGSRRTSRRLSEVRERLRSDLHVLAPCPHAEQCGMLVPANERHWCHFFGRPSQEAFTEGRWAEFGRALGIDLRSLPYCFLALGREGSETPPAGQARLLGRPRLRRGAASLDVCREDGVHDVQLLERTAKPLLKRLAKSFDEPWLVELELDGAKVTHIARR